MSRKAPKNEKDVKLQIQHLCKQAGAYYAMPHQAGFGVAGVPDFLICHRGRFAGVEAKFGSNKPTAHQRLQLDKVERAGGAALVINEANTYELARWLDIDV